MANYKEPTLFLVRVNGRDTAAVIALNPAEARDYVVAHCIEVSVPTSAQAFRIGNFGEIALHYAKPEYDTREEDDKQLDFFGGRRWSPDVGAGKTCQLNCIAPAFDGHGELTPPTQGTPE